jgi:hypothetical protein
VTKNCTENSGNQFRIGATPAYSYRVDNLHVHLDFYSEIPVTVKVYTESGYVETLYDESGGYFGATIPSALHHTWSAGSYGWGSYSWISSTGLGNHCGSNFVDIV